MNVDRIVRLVAGTVILVSLALARWHDPNWGWLTAFVGFNLAQSGLTNVCPLAFILKKSGVPEGNCC